MAGTPSSAYWVNFRSSASPSGFPGDDGTFDVNNLGEKESALAGTKKIGGIYVQGWGSGWSGSAGDDNTYNTRHVAGYNVTANVGTQMFHIGGLTIGHNYRLWMSIAPLFGPGPTGVSGWQDSSNSIPITGSSVSGGSATLDNGASLAAGSIRDIRGNVFTSAASWLSGQDYLDYVAGTADMYFTRSTGFATFYPNAIGIEDMTVGARGSNLSMMGV